MEGLRKGRESWGKSGLFIGIGLIVMGFLLKSAIMEFKSSERVVNVKGLSEREVKADRVIWPLLFKEIGDDMLVLYERIDQNNKVIMDYLISNGISKDEVSISAPEIIDMKAERYGSQDANYRYNVTSIITVSTDKVDLVRKLISGQADLLKKGIALASGDYRYKTEYMFTQLNEVKPAMVEEATKNARQTAEKFAIDSESKLGKIKNATQGQFSISNRDESTPYIKKVRVVTNVQYYLED